MRVQDLIVRQTQRALDDFLRSVEALPEERRDWTPMGEARSALDMLREVAWAPAFYLPFLSPGEGDWGAGHTDIREKAREPMSFDEGRERARRATNELCIFISSVPYERLEEEVTLPFGGGMVLTMAEVLGIHTWNLVYHLGQVNAYQRMLGDVEMH